RHSHGARFRRDSRVVTQAIFGNEDVRADAATPSQRESEIEAAARIAPEISERFEAREVRPQQPGPHSRALLRHRESRPRDGGRGGRRSNSPDRPRITRYFARRSEEHTSELQS